MRDTAIAAAYWPLIRGYALIMGVYYGAMSIANLALVRGFDLIPFAGTSIASCLAAFAVHRVLYNERDKISLFAATTVINALVLLNVEVALNLEFSEQKLSYFIIAVMIFGLASMSTKQALSWSAIALGLLSYRLAFQAPELGYVFVFVAFAAAMAGGGISSYLRKAVCAATEAELGAKEALRTAEHNLDEAKYTGLKLEKESLSDSLTGLSNRRAFFGALRELGTAKDGGWLALLDLDGFKAVNDNHGHIVGDELLKSVSFRLRTFCSDRAQVSRIGGDEFGLVIQHEMSEDELIEWMEKLLSRLAKTFPIEGRLIQISGSIGCCRIENGEHESAVFKSADFALLHAKRSGKNRVVSFDDEHARAFAERYRIEQALRGADLEKEVELVFQPQFDLRTQSTVRAEVLARWNSPALGSISPDDFISVAEECGLMMDITVAVLRKSIRAINDWEEPIPLSINLSGADINSTQTMDEIIHLLENAQIDPSMIEFEITETAMLIDAGRATEQLQRLAELGHSIAIDDFGTGYSNFAYLRALPINKLKIDRSFLEDLNDPITEKILRSLVSVAATLDVECLLEGVENELALLLAKRSGFGMVQGFLIGRPTDAESLEMEYLEETSAKVG